MRRRRPRPRRATSTTRISKRAKSPTRPRKKKRSTDRGGSAGRLAYLSLGSNRGNRRARLERALSELSRLAPILAVSAFYRSEPVGFAAQPAFWNLVAVLRWRGSAPRLLSAVKSVERAVGRTPSFRNGPREIDVDILDFGGARRLSGDPILPHPRMEGRRFVLAPLSEIAPEWRHPVSGRSAAELLEKLPSRPSATRLSSRPRRFASRLPGP